MSQVLVRPVDHNSDVPDKVIPADVEDYGR